MLGRDQVALLCVYLLIGYVVATWFAQRDGDALGERIVRSLPALIAGGVAGAAIVALPVLFTLALADQSNRPAIDYQGAAAGSLHPALLITGVAPHLFGAAR